MTDNDHGRVLRSNHESCIRVLEGDIAISIPFAFLGGALSSEAKMENYIISSVKVVVSEEVGHESLPYIIRCKKLHIYKLIKIKFKSSSLELIAVEVYI